MAERFINAAKDGYVDLLREATRKDLNTPDEDGMTATLWAAHSGNLEALRLIAGREGDVNKADFLGLTALHHATMRGHMGVVSYLVHWGCNVYALDNDFHSALDLAAMNNRHDIVKFLDNDLAQRQAKNPRQAARLKEEAMKAAENNVKRYEKMQEAAARKAEKEQKKLQKEMSQHQQNGVDNENKPKMSLFKTLTLRIKGQGNYANTDKIGTYHGSKYSDFVGLADGGTRKGIARKIKMRQMETLTPNSEFKVSDVDNQGNRTFQSLGPAQGFVGSTSEVLYRTANRGPESQANVGKRPALSHDVFQKSNLYKAKSESDLLDSGVDSYYDEDEAEDGPGMFNRPEFGKLAFLPKNPFLNTIQSFDDSSLPTNTSAINGHHQTSEGEDNKSEIGSDVTPRHQALPWDQDDLGNLDDDEEDMSNEFTAVNMFLWSCGLASYLHIFSQEKIDMPLLMKMTDLELKELGLPFGPRKKLREAIATRNAILERPSRMVDSYL